MLDAAKCGNQCKILVIESDRVVSSLLCDFLNNRGHVVELASSFREALQSVSYKSFDVILTEINFHVHENFDFIKAIKNGSSDAELIITTSVALPGLLRLALKKDVFALVFKPFNLIEIESIIEQAQNYRKAKVRNRRLRAMFQGIISKPKINELGNTEEEIEADEQREFRFFKGVNQTQEFLTDSQKKVYLEKLIRKYGSQKPRFPYLNSELTRKIELIGEIFDAQRVSIMLYNKNTNSLKLTNSTGTNTHELHSIETRVDDDSPAGWVIRHGLPMLVEDAANDTRVRRKRNITDANNFNYRGNSFIIALIEYNDNPVGVLNVTDKNCDPFTNEDLETLKNFAGWLMNDIQNVLTADSILEKYYFTLEEISKKTEAFEESYQGHSIRVTHIARVIGELVGLTTEEMDKLRRASMFHDLGNIQVKKSLLVKKNSLNLEEYREIQRHAEAINSLFHGVPFVEDVKTIIFHHHERFDGTGYPGGLKGNEIPVCARILHIAEVYEALTSHRPHREPYTKKQAGEWMLSNASKQFDPDILEKCQRFFRVTK